ncbi:MAG: hypothetical protein C4542_09265 [Dehalococcoidia bacterium]|nr:MAG: hypothetical protein C4542_09265 [Dehalococcoidia bacterium]
MDSFLFLITAVLTMVLVITGFYYSIQSKKQLEKNLDETRAEVAMASRPLLVIRAVVHEAATTYVADSVSAPKGAQKTDDRPLTSHFSHFELFNAGNSPAISLKISLMNAEKAVLQGETLGFLRNNEQALTFVPIKLELHKTYYLVCEYESVRSRVSKIWYQTWLPFTAIEGTVKSLINVNVGELDFKEVPASVHSIASLKPK